MIEASGCLGLDASRSLLSEVPDREGSAVWCGGFGFAWGSPGSTQDLGINAPRPSGRGGQVLPGRAPGFGRRRTVFRALWNEPRALRCQCSSGGCG
jgi:hypothetical protein